MGGLQGPDQKMVVSLIIAYPVLKLCKVNLT
jgi:hypothetical protein